MSNPVRRLSAASADPSSVKERSAWPRRTLHAVLVLFLILSGCQSPNGAVTASKEPAGARSPTAAVQLPPPPPRFVFAVKGDWGAGTPEQAAVTQQMCRTRQSTPFDVVITTGDNFYRPDSVATEGNYYRPEACLIAFRGHTWRASWGNHDVAGSSTSTVLGAPRFYRWSGGDLEFFVLDSNRASDPAQAEWLKEQLEHSRAPVKVAVFHHAAYTVGLYENNPDVIRHWVPLFERYGVRLVLTGHNHAYEHSLVNGIHYVVTGGGGAQLYPCVRSEAWLIKCLPAHHFLLAEAVGSRLTIRAVDASGGVIDSFVVE